MSHPIRKLRLTAVSAAVVCLLPALTSCSRNDAQAAPPAADVADPPPQPLPRLSRADLSAESRILTAEFEPFQEVDVMAKVSGLHQGGEGRYRRSRARRPTSSPSSRSLRCRTT